jgi:hypothetical protein
LYSQNKFIYKGKDYNITLSLLTKNDSLAIEFEFENRRKESLLVSKEYPSLSLRWSDTGKLLELIFGTDLKPMNEATFLIETINPYEKRVISINTSLPNNKEFILYLTTNLFWVKSNKRMKKYNTDYNLNDYDWSEIYFPIKW